MNPLTDLRTTRIRKKLRVGDLACGMLRPATISEIENGLRVPKPNTRKKIESLIGKVDWRRTLANGGRSHLVYAMTELINEGEGGDLRGRIKFARQILKMIEETL